MWRALADGMVGIHYAYIAYMIVGGFIAWRWRKTIVVHVVAVVWAVLIVTTKVPCPVTALQNNFRQRAGDAPLSDSFINVYIRGTFYPEGQQTLSRIVVGGLILLSWVGYYYLRRTARTARPAVVGSNL
ncbi:MAG: DUF2784 domain-containing protein [Pseudonocardiales bacterium]|nr:MAG: DUF2784 domain-containing protein [Pseudonocardiales bacterium]